MTNVGSERSIPILRPVGNLDELNLVTVAFTVGTRLVLGEGSKDERFGRFDVSRRTSSPNLTRGEIKKVSDLGSKGSLQ